MNDEEIIALYWERNELAIRETQVRYGYTCFRIAQNILKSREDCEECVNETWLRAWNGIPPAKPNNLKQFLITITRNLAFNTWRRQTAERRGGGEMEAVLDELEECVSASGNPEDQLLGQELRNTINSFLENLTVRERDIFLRRYYYVESVQEIGERYGIKDGNVSVILWRVRKKLRKHLEKEGFLE